MISNPHYRLAPDLLRRLTEAVDADVTRRAPPFTPYERKRISAHIGLDAMDALLKPCKGRVEVVDATYRRQRKNIHYDFLLDGRIRVKAKCGTYVESIGWTQKEDPDGTDLDFDVLVVVDAGVTLSSAVGRLARYAIPMRETVDYYVLPQPVVRRWVMERGYVNGKGVQIYLYKRPFDRPGTAEEMGETRELAEFRNRFDPLNEAIGV
jgi:hypothetical protein